MKAQRNQSKAAELSSDEKLLAALCHLSLFFLPIIIPLVLWLREKNQSTPSTFVIVQARQSLVYQIIFMVVLVGVGLFVILLSILLVGYLFVPAYLILLFSGVLYAAYAGYQSFLGYDFRYYYLGDKLEEF
ncbi:MAG: DUF4870 domain-containing protein [Nitrosopumilaceae archaeon]|nr:DUF4870 domain-containing protein [Nitrosopumilaceae archaeon]NIX61846.1 DUF4870 domain-containing protein [Nitrosopumilaceae archaeon]